MAKLVSACPPATDAAERDGSVAVLSKGRQRLQARSGRILDVNQLASAWPTLPAALKQTVAETAGAGTGSIFAEHSRDTRSGWLQDHHITVKTLATLSLPVHHPGQRCGAPS